MPRFKNNICVNPITWKNEGPISNLTDSKAVHISKFCNRLYWRFTAKGSLLG